MLTSSMFLIILLGYTYIIFFILGARMYVLGKDYIVAKGVATLLPKVGNLVDFISTEKS
jgi:hypothetical protein